MSKTIESPDVWVTGVAMITPLGIDAETSWRNLKLDKSGISRFDFDPKSRSQIRFINAGLIPDFSLENYAKYLTPQQIRKLEDRAHRSAQFALGVSIDALIDARLYTQNSDNTFLDTTLIDPQRLGISIGTGFGGSLYTGNAFSMLAEKGKVPTNTALQVELERVTSVPSLYIGARGPGLTVGTACATGSSAIAEGARKIMLGEADVVIAGGVEAMLGDNTHAQITAATYGQLRAMSREDDLPEKASRPFDESAAGFIPGEGAGVLILESEKHARARGIIPYARLFYGETMDACYETAPANEGRGLQEAMRLALNRSGHLAKDIDYINAHGTGTKTGDPEEKKAIEQVLPSDSKASISSTKSMTGHLLGAAGGVEAVIAVLALRDQFVPGTANLQNLVDGEDGLDWLRQGKARRVRVTMSNSAGFGGFNVCLLFDFPDEMI